MARAGTVPGSRRQATRERILRTFARMVVEEGLHDVSIQQIADRAGITHRTVYRYFETRQDLVDHLADWLNERGAELGQIQHIDSIDKLPAAIAKNARTFDQDADLITALVLVTYQNRTVARAQRHRTDEFARLMGPVISHLEPDDAQAVTFLVRYLASSRTWQALREEFGIPGETSGPVVGWVVQLLLDALRKGEGPMGGDLRRRELHDGETGAV